MIDCEARISRDLNNDYVDVYSDLEKQNIISLPEIVEAEVEAAYRAQLNLRHYMIMQNSKSRGVLDVNG